MRDRDGRLRIGIDLDGVVADFNAGWIELYNREFGTAISPDEVVGWDQMLVLTHFPEMDEFWTWARSAHDDRRCIFRRLGIYPGAVEALRELVERHHVAIVSHKFPWAIPDTLAWLAELEVPLQEIHFLRAKARVDCDVYLEDAPYQLADLRAGRPHAVVCRFVRPWNEPVEGCVDIHDWAEFVAYVDALEPPSQVRADLHA